ncbi:hypothetical protein [Sphingomonas sp. MS122]|uniref:hypothetical protein n=1 Tax=Sphingomonas sp. MS122 TaxID=3412683 RepID=UPI003C307324
MLSLGGTQEASPARLAEIWRSYRYAEYHANGGYICNRYQQRWITRRFRERFGRRVAALKAAAQQRLEKSAFEAEFPVITICAKAGPDASLPAWVRTNFKTYEAELAAAERAFGTSQGAH